MAPSAALFNRPLHQSLAVNGVSILARRGWSQGARRGNENTPDNDLHAGGVHGHSDFFDDGLEIFHGAIGAGFGPSSQQTMEQPPYRAYRVASPSAPLVRFFGLRKSRKVLIAIEEAFI